MDAAPMEDQRPAGRPKLNLKPRDEAAAKKAEADRQAKLTHNPFGAAKPREMVLASRTGKTEEEVLKEEVKHEKLRLRLTAAQLTEKQALEALVEEAKGQLEAAGGRDEALQTLITEREAAVEDLMEQFAHASLEAAARGEIQRPSERRQAQQALFGAGGPPPPGVPAPYESTGRPAARTGSFGDGGRGGGFSERYMDRGGSGSFGAGFDARDNGAGGAGGGGGRGERPGGYMPPPEPGAGRYSRDREPSGEWQGGARQGSGGWGGKGGRGWNSGGGGGERLVLPGMPAGVGELDGAGEYAGSGQYHQDRF